MVTVEEARVAALEGLARGLAGAAYTSRGRRVWCKVCETFRQFGHRPDCPVAEAERLLAEQGKEAA